MTFRFDPALSLSETAQELAAHTILALRSSDQRLMFFAAGVASGVVLGFLAARCRVRAASSDSADAWIGRSAPVVPEPRSQAPARQTRKRALNPVPMAEMDDPRQKRAKVGVIAFYYPGRELPWDRKCGAGFLGNFWPLPQDEQLAYAPPSFPDKTLHFNNTESAFQALKYWDKHGEEFAHLSGGAAFELKKALMREQPDLTYAGNGGNWQGMLAVLRQKFRAGTQMAEGLERTGDHFLLEHNERADRDKVWSDNLDGTGTNWLGLQLMILREEQRGAQGCWTQLMRPWIDLQTGAPKGDAGANAWQDVVMSATRVVVRGGTE